MGYLLVGLLYMYPLVQTTFFFSMSLLTLLYLFVKRPIQDRLNFVVILVNEYLIFIVNMGTMTLVANTAINTCSSVFTWVYIVYAMWVAFQNSRRLDLNGKTTWINVLVSPYQNPGMDFHEEGNHLDHDSKAALQKDNEDHLKPDEYKSVILNDSIPKSNRLTVNNTNNLQKLKST